MGDIEGANDARAVEAAKTQSLFRTVNERVEELNEAFAPVVPLGEWVCECADLACIQPIEMLISEYEAIRSHSNRFFVAPAHVDFDVERVVGEGDGYVIVEKIGAGAEFAARHDRRSQGRDGRAAARARNEDLHGRQSGQ